VNAQHNRVTIYTVINYFSGQTLFFRWYN